MRKLCWNLGVALDILHAPLAIIVLVLGSLWMPSPFYLVVAGSIIALQVLCLGCPLNVVTCWLRRRYKPDYNYWGSLTFWLYHRYGRKVGILILAICIVLSYFVAQAIIVLE